MSELSTIRHQSIFNVADGNDIPVHIIGAGAVGSRLWLTLVELGMTKVSVYDYDKVEAHNLANQLYLTRDLGSPKVEGLRAYYKDKTGAEPPDTMHFYDTKVTHTEPESWAPIAERGGIVFLAVDTMAARKEIFHEILGQCENVFWIFDIRIASSYGNVFTVNPFDTKDLTRWNGTLFDDSEAEVSPCGTSITVSPTVNIITNIAVWQMIHALTNKEALENNILLHLKPLMLNQ